MYQLREAENDDVNLLLDMKLDIIFNSEAIIDLDKKELEKIVNYCEEEIRTNLSNCTLIVEDGNIIAFYMVVDYDDGKLIDTIYVIKNHRLQGIGTYIVNKIINTNYKPLYLWVYKSNENAINLYKKLGFTIIEETKDRLFMRNDNDKKENQLIKAQTFCNEVEQISKKYNLEYFFITEGASVTKVDKSSVICEIKSKYGKVK